MVNDARGLANFFLELANAESFPLTHLHVQKILYNAHGWHLAYTDNPLFFQTVQAWKYGPVIPDVYRAFRDAGKNPIDAPATFYHDGSFIPYSATLDNDEKEFLKKVWAGHKNVSAGRLSAMSHAPDGPWDIVSKGKNLEEHKGVPIPNELIREYFKNFLNQQSSNESAK